MQVVKTNSLRTVTISADLMRLTAGTKLPGEFQFARSRQAAMRGDGQRRLVEMTCDGPADKNSSSASASAFRGTGGCAVRSRIELLSRSNSLSHFNSRYYLFHARDNVLLKCWRRLHART